MTIPSSIFRYRTLKKLDLGRYNQELDAIKNNYLWLSKFENLNDPMEFSFKNNFGKNDALGAIEKVSSKSSKDVYEAVENAIRTVKEYAVCCFSKSAINEPLWAYYADNFRGMCIEYDSATICNVKTGEEHPLLEVDYIYTLPKFDFNSIAISRVTRDTKSLTTIFLATKKIVWKHEEEVRLVRNKACKFNLLENTIKSITIGPRMPKDTESDILKLAKISGFIVHRINAKNYTLDLEKLDL